MSRSRRAIVEELRARQLEKRAIRRRRWRWALFVAGIVLLLLLLRDCSCAEPPEPVGPGPVGEGTAAEPVEPVAAPAPLTGRIERRDRPEFGSAPPKPLPWIASFRLQVAARGPRLAECFVGAQRPGALKWTASVEPDSGRVSDSVLEPTRESDALTSGQRACVLEVLSDPAYRLQTGEARSTPSRVGIAIEF